MKRKQLLAVALSAVTAISLAACTSNTPDTNDSGTSSSESAEAAVSIDQINLGTDYKDIKADLKFVTHRTDLADTDFAEYIKDFQKMYPNVSIEYEGITNYVDDFTTRLSTGDWGDICMIPTTISKSDLGQYFLPFGDSTTLEKKYTLLDNFTYDKKVYGMPSMANLCGVVYNKKVFEQAGITKAPATPEEFISDLQKIKDKTEAIPMYTNFAAGWTMTAWDAYIGGVSTGDPNFNNAGLDEGKDPFSDRKNGTGPYAVYNTLYEAVSKKLTEEDPTTTDWEGSKGMLNSGKIGCMALGSWAIPQMQAAGKNAGDIAYMPFPISVDGTQYAVESPDYCYGINKNSSKDNQIAAACYVKYLMEKSGYAASQGGVDCMVGAKLPDVLKDFETDTIKIITENASPAGKETLHNDINNDSELGLNVSGACAKAVVQNAVSGGESMQELSDEWNKAWTQAQENNGVTPKAYTPVPAKTAAN